VTTFTPADKRYMVSPCGYMADWFDVSEIADEAPGWTDCSEMSDVEIGQLMERRMRAADQRKRDSRDEDRAERAQWHREYDLIHV
jgi:hypothetical protein